MQLECWIISLWELGNHGSTLAQMSVERYDVQTIFRNIIELVKVFRRSDEYKVGHRDILLVFQKHLKETIDTDDYVAIRGDIVKLDWTALGLKGPCISSHEL